MINLIRIQCKFIKKYRIMFVGFLILAFLLSSTLVLNNYYQSSHAEHATYLDGNVSNNYFRGSSLSDETTEKISDQIKNKVSNSFNILSIIIILLVLMAIILFFFFTRKIMFSNLKIYDYCGYNFFHALSIFLLYGLQMLVLIIVLIFILEALFRGTIVRIFNSNILSIIKNYNFTTDISTYGVIISIILCFINIYFIYGHINKK